MVKTVTIYKEYSEFLLYFQVNFLSWVIQCPQKAYQLSKCLDFAAFETTTMTAVVISQCSFYYLLLASQPCHQLAISTFDCLSVIQASFCLWRFFPVQLVCRARFSRPLVNCVPRNCPLCNRHQLLLSHHLLSELLSTLKIISYLSAFILNLNI